MSTTLLNTEVQLSKDMGDYFTSAATSAGAAGGTTIVDTALQAYGTGWITKNAWAMLTSGTYNEQERKISSLSTSTLTTLAFGGQVASGVTYRVHRVASPSDKRLAILEAMKDAFPDIHDRVRDDRERSNNWLRNGFPSKWTLTTVPDNWVVSALTCAENTTAPYYLSRGTSSMKLSTTAGYVYQSVTQCPHFQELAGQTVIFEARGWSSTASQLRLAIYDGTTTTYSSYHDGDSSWNDPTQQKLWVQYTFPYEPTNIEFRVYYDDNSAACYVNDMRVTGPRFEKVYVGHLGLARNRPVSVYQKHQNYIYSNEPWFRLRSLEIDENGWMYLPNAERDYILRIEGEGYLDYLASGVSSTAWTATINLDDPQIKILAAQAGLWLYGQYIMPNMTTGNEDAFVKGLQYFDHLLQERKAIYGMDNSPAISDFGAR